MPKWNPDVPFNDLPSLPPAVDIENREILKKCISSRAAVAQVTQASKLLPNPSILINTIPILEAQASSEIENIVTTTDRLFQFAAHENQADPETKEALRYRTALYQGYRSLKTRPLCTTTIVEVCHVIKGIELGIRTTPGTKLVNHVNGQVIYTPPEGSELLRKLLRNLDEFIHRDDGIDPLIKMAVMHYQFEAIHPFIDGNGRTGRILNLLYLINAGVLEIPILYLSGYIIRHKADYYRLLLEVTAKGHWEEWICFILCAVEKTALWTVQIISNILSLMQKLTATLRTQSPQLYSRELVEVLFTQPYCRIVNLVDAGIAKRQTASHYLNELTKMNVLRQIQSGREKLFINSDFLRLLTSWPLLN